VKLPIWLIAALLSICSASAGQLLLKVGVRGAHLPDNPLQQPLSLVLALFQPLIICGIIAEATSMMLWLAAINTRALSAVYPMAALGYVIVTVVSVVFFGEGLSIGKIAGIALIVLGVVVLNSGFGPLTTGVAQSAAQAEGVR
jgi:multidrug transporter EmrE-like cation transporter